jgi:hypothetical protein
MEPEGSLRCLEEPVICTYNTVLLYFVPYEYELNVNKCQASAGYTNIYIYI